MRRRESMYRCVVCTAAIVLMASVSTARAGFVELKPPGDKAGYLARLLINENPFPGEKSYVSEDDTKTGMLSVLWVLHSRIHHIPIGYRQEHIATLRTESVIDVMTAKGQFEGFYKDAKGKPSTAPRVEERVQNLLRIANSGGKPGRFAGLLNYAQGLASAYMKDGIQGADRFAGISAVNKVAVTGRAYSWMTDKDCYNPGGNYISIPDAEGGSPGGNRFYTLRKDPR
jgi:hypothetical protein